MAEARYDRIGSGYRKARRPDPRIAVRIEQALGDAGSVLNVGAGAGSYEPADREVVAVEPSEVMIAQRPPDSAPVLKASAEALPFPDGSFDAAMAVLTVHHWRDPEVGVREMRRIARDRAVILTYSPDHLHWWLRDYAPEIFVRDERRFPSLEEILGWLGGGSVEVVEVPADCTDLFLGALWARPELMLDAEVRAATSGFAELDDAREEAAVGLLRADLDNGRWEERHGHLRGLRELDVGLRLVAFPTG